MGNLRVASMFAGIGGICTAFERAGFQVVWANEIDKAACNAYRYNMGNWLVEGDIRDISSANIPDIDILTAGFPCQSFSIAGKQKGFNDPRGNLFFEIARVVDVKRPPVVFLENVDNLIEHDDGKTFLVIYTSLAQFGYTVKYKIMPAHIYGNLPQPRRRIYLGAFLNIEDCDAFSFPEPIELTVNINSIINRSEQKHEIYYYDKDSTIYRRFGKRICDRNYIYRVSDKGLIRVRDRLCPTLTANMGTYPDRVPIICDDYGIRRLTLRECLDFQGFPQNFRFPNSITLNDAYKQIGNSVCVPVIERIAKNLKNVLFQSSS